MTKYVKPTYRTYVTREADPTDSWSQDDIDGTFTGVIKCERLDWDAFETELSGIVHAVYVEYNTGNTFGSDYRAEVLEVFAESWQADEFIAVAKGTKGPNDWSFEYNGKSYHRNWIGYFERLIDLSYETIVI